MKRILIVLVLFVLLIGATGVREVPHVEVFEIPSGHTCVTDYRDGNAYTQCFCSCGAEFELIEEEFELIVEYVDPVPNPEPTPDPTRCNRGLGNGAERCDPGKVAVNLEKQEKMTVELYELIDKIGSTSDTGT